MLNDNVRQLPTITQAMLHVRNGEVKFFHVLCNHKQGSWSVKIDDYKDAVFTSEDKAECVAEAKSLAFLKSHWFKMMMQIIGRAK